MASNSLTGMSVVNVASAGLAATPTTTGTFTANLPSTDTGGGTGTPSSSNYSEQTSIVMYDNVGASQTVDLYYLNTSPTTQTSPPTYTWTVAAYEFLGHPDRQHLDPGFQHFGRPDLGLAHDHSRAQRLEHVARPVRHDPAGRLLFGVDIDGERQRRLPVSSVTIANGRHAFLSAPERLDGLRLQDSARLRGEPGQPARITGNAYSPNILSGQARSARRARGSWARSIPTTWNNPQSTSRPNSPT